MVVSLIVSIYLIVPYVMSLKRLIIKMDDAHLADVGDDDDDDYASYVYCYYCTLTVKFYTDWHVDDGDDDGDGVNDDDDDVAAFL